MLECAGNPAWLLDALAFLKSKRVICPTAWLPPALSLLGSQSSWWVPSQTIPGRLNFSPRVFCVFLAFCPAPRDGTRQALCHGMDRTLLSKLEASIFALLTAQVALQLCGHTGDVSLPQVHQHSALGPSNRCKYPGIPHMDPFTQALLQSFCWLTV